MNDEAEQKKLLEVYRYLILAQDAIGTVNDCGIFAKSAFNETEQYAERGRLWVSDDQLYDRITTVMDLLRNDVKSVERWLVENQEER